MKTSTLTRGMVAAVVVILAAVIIYPKLMSPNDNTLQSAGQATNNQTSASAVQSQGESALSAALKSGKPTMILFHSNT